MKNFCCFHSGRSIKRGGDSRDASPTPPLPSGSNFLPFHAVFKENLLGWGPHVWNWCTPLSDKSWIRHCIIKLFFSFWKFYVCFCPYRLNILSEATHNIRSLIDRPTEIHLWLYWAFLETCEDHPHPLLPKNYHQIGTEEIDFKFTLSDLCLQNYSTNRHSRNRLWTLRWNIDRLLFVTGLTLYYW